MPPCNIQGILKNYLVFIQISNLSGNPAFYLATLFLSYLLVHLQFHRHHLRLGALITASLGSAPAGQSFQHSSPFLICPRAYYILNLSKMLFSLSFSSTQVIMVAPIAFQSNFQSVCNCMYARVLPVSVYIHAPWSVF